MNSSSALGQLFVFSLPSMSKPEHEKPGKAATHRTKMVHKLSVRKLFVGLWCDSRENDALLNQTSLKK